MEKTKNLDGGLLTPSDPAIPCGLIAKSMFNDTFRLFNKSAILDAKPGVNPEIEISSSGIAWPSDLDGRYKNIDKTK